MGSALGAQKSAALRIGLPFEEYRRRIESGQKFCTACRSWHDRGLFGRDSNREDGLAASCGEARRAARQARYVPRPPKSRRGIPLVPTRDGDAHQARHRISHLVEIGAIPTANSLPCTDCGHLWAPDERRHEYDHHRGYGAEHQLDVQSVCTTCHAAREERRGKRERARGARGRFARGNARG